MITFLPAQAETLLRKQRILIGARAMAIYYDGRRFYAAAWDDQDNRTIEYDESLSNALVQLALALRAKEIAT